jgi:pimeloyl-ACP methyl ester carboxylesterase
MLHRLLNSLILLPERYCYQTPADLGLCAREVTFPNAQGQQLHGLLCQPSDPETQRHTFCHDSPVVLFCPGTSGNLSSHLYYIEVLCRAGCTVLGFDYTGFGQSAGTAALQHLITDVLCASDFLRQVKHIDCHGIFGLSIGANVALLAASLRPEHISGVVVEGLARQREVIQGILSNGIMGPRDITTILYEGEPQGSRPAHLLNSWRLGRPLADVFAWVGSASFPCPGKDPYDLVRSLTDIPVFFIHGVEDPLLPFETTWQTYQAKRGAKCLWLIPGVGHAQEPILDQDAEYAAQLRAFFHQTDETESPFDSIGPPIRCEVSVSSTARVALQLRNPGAPGLALTTIMRDQTVDFRTIWVDDEATLADLTPGTRFQASCLRLFEVSGYGDTAQTRLTLRGQRYRAVFQPYIRQLSQTLHEGRLNDLEALLHALPQEKPEEPFDFFLGVYCAQIMHKTQHKKPRIARAAAEAWQRYWRYGTHVAPSTPTPWDLVCAILGEQAHPISP